MQLGYFTFDCLEGLDSFVCVEHDNFREIFSFGFDLSLRP